MTELYRNRTPHLLPPAERQPRLVEVMTEHIAMLKSGRKCPPAVLAQLERALREETGHA